MILVAGPYRSGTGDDPERMAEQPGVYFGRDEWPYGRTGPALPHGAVFARP